ncbi:DMT family transporter [Shewanella sp. KCT]|uniref:DMT family transporter n=1 Tax=Shewanella sp. KCT TaxID=2569535 RepID=UPI0021B20FD1|nr:DMT family transporter [Shewanella sp. KCT]TVP08884.1 hypothetical protein AYI87_20740 [Shewanella sp. KCT]
MLLSALVGVLLISFGDNIFDHNQDDFSSLYLGIALAFVAAIFYALITLLTRRVEGMSPALIAFFQVNIGSFLLLPFVDSTKIMTESGLIYVIVLGVVHTGVMYILLYGAVRKITIYSIAAISFFYPITALIIDLLVFGVELTSLQYLGLVLVMCSSVSVSLIESKRII